MNFWYGRNTYKALRQKFIVAKLVYKGTLCTVRSWPRTQWFIPSPPKIYYNAMYRPLPPRFHQYKCKHRTSYFQRLLKDQKNNITPWYNSRHIWWSFITFFVVIQRERFYQYHRSSNIYICICIYTICHFVRLLYTGITPRNFGIRCQTGLLYRINSDYSARPRLVHVFHGTITKRKSSRDQWSSVVFLVFFFY